MKQIKVSDLEDEQLAEWTAKAQEWHSNLISDPITGVEEVWVTKEQEIACPVVGYRPDINSAQAMELAKKFKLIVKFGAGMAWFRKEGLTIKTKGNTDEIAITRAAIASVYGETVTMEDE